MSIMKTLRGGGELPPDNYDLNRREKRRKGKRQRQARKDQRRLK